MPGSSATVLPWWHLLNRQMLELPPATPVVPDTFSGELAPRWVLGSRDIGVGRPAPIVASPAGPPTTRRFEDIVGPVIYSLDGDRLADQLIGPLHACTALPYQHLTGGS